MIKLTITIGPAPGGVGVNVRQDGDPANHLEVFWLEAMKFGIRSATDTATKALSAAGIVEPHEIKTGEAARVAGEERNGTPGQFSKN